MEKFQQLRVWQKMHGLVLDVYKLTSSYPDSEKYGLISQMRRAAVSVAANIAEGTKRHTIPDRIHFHCMADASLEELKYYFVLGVDLKLINKAESEALMAAAREVGGMLGALNKAIKA